MMLVYASAVIVVGWAAAYFGVSAWREMREERARREREREEVNVVLNGGYHPDRIVVHRGRPIRLNIARTNDGVSGWIDFEFPYAHIAWDLPEDETVAVDIGPLEPGDYALFAHDGTMRGTLAVEDADRRRPLEPINLMSGEMDL